MRFVAATIVLAAASGAANAGLVLSFTDVSGLSAEAEFTLIDPSTVEIRLRNTSTGAPLGFDGADQILTGLSWSGGGNSILGGSAVIAAGSSTVNFDSGTYGAGTNVGGEWGYGNSGISGALANGISALTAGTTAFGGPNLDGPVSIDGPQGGLVADPMVVSLGGQGAIQSEIVATINLSAAINDIGDLFGNDQLARVEFGSDAHFITVNVPAPGALAPLAGAMLLATRRRRTAG